MRADYDTPASELLKVRLRCRRYDLEWEGESLMTLRGGEL